MSLRKKLIGDSEFYKRMFGVMLPVLLQNVITNFVSLLDNVMVGRIGTEQMSGVAIMNQLLFIFNLVIFGGLAGPGIYCAQFYGKGDQEGVKNTMRAKLWVAAFAFLVFGTAFVLRGKELMSLFIHEGEDNIDLTATLHYGMEYLKVIFWQMPLFAMINVYASTMRETGDTKTPMAASILAVLINLMFNWILIYGKLGAPALGVTGAAIATVLSRIVELTILIITSAGLFKGVFRTVRVPVALARDIAIKGAPLMFNELMWSTGMTTLVQVMSLKGIEVVSAENISNTVSNLFFCCFFAMGSTISIIVGQLLGAGLLERAVDEDRKLIAFSVVFSAVIGGIMIFLAPFIPRIYNTSDMVKSLAASFLVVNALMMPANAFTNSAFFTLRSGGKVWITFLYDSVYLWVLAIPVTKALVTYSSLDVTMIYGISYFIDIIKCVFGFILVKKRTWVNNLVSDL